MSNSSQDSNWTGIEYGTIGNHEVTFSQGLGPKSGETLISDGHISKSDFDGKPGDRGHNHYGNDSQGRGRIEDLGGDRGKYTGPGC